MTEPMRPEATRVGRYAIVESIARGGYATIYRGTAEPDGRTVAIKRLHPHYVAEHEVRAMFRDESRVLSRIEHPNVLRHLDVVEQDDELFLIVEHVEGITLQGLLKHARETKTPLPLPVAIAVALDVLAGLTAAHGATDERGRPLGVVHRDVTPDNILIGKDGIARLVDFGMSRALGQYHSTSHNVIRGKLGYIAPELILRRQPSQQSDVFSAAAVVWEALTGRRLFRGKTLTALSKAVLHDPIPAPSTRAPIPEAVDRAVMKGLERDLEARWPSATAFSDALAAAATPATHHEVGAAVLATGANEVG